MVIQSVTNPTPPVPITGSSLSSTTTGPGGTQPSEQMFLQLLVAQIKNQDPTSPSDPSQFVAQLAQFSQLEQVIAIRQDVDNINASIPAPATTTNTGTTGTTSA